MVGRLRDRLGGGHVEVVVRMVCDRVSDRRSIWTGDFGTVICGHCCIGRSGRQPDRDRGQPTKIAVSLVACPNRIGHLVCYRSTSIAALGVSNSDLRDRIRHFGEKIRVPLFGFDCVQRLHLQRVRKN